MSRLEPYDPALAPRAFGLVNTGAICYMNSLLQVLLGCTSVTRAVLDHAAYFGRTPTGAALVDFFRRATAFDGGPGESLDATDVLGALVSDLALRRPRTRFGAGHESASEALALLVDMLEPEGDGRAASDTGDGQLAPGSAESPLTRLLLHRYRSAVECRGCGRVISKGADNALTLQLFHFDAMKQPPQTPAEFARAILAQSAHVELRCPHCRGASATRRYRLSMVPEVLFFAFNLYGPRPARYFPPRFELPGRGGGHVYRLVGQVEHSGGLEGGHYWARALRADGRAWLLDDRRAAPTAFGPTPDTYLVAYHAEKAPGAGPGARPA